MRFFKNLCSPFARRRRGGNSFTALQILEDRLVMTAQPLPVLMVIADQHDFYYQEYGDTRNSLEAAGVEVVVAATTTNPSFPHAGTGEGAGSGMVVPDIALSNVDPSEYSAIAFVGGWGSSMYQYAFPGDYVDGLYDGDAATKSVVNDLISEFLAQDKFVSAICHGTTILAWARVGGVSPLAGKVVSVPYIGSPAVNYNGVDYGYYQLGQYEQAVANGAIANTSSGQYGVTGTATDDVVVDGRIITAENYDSAALFGTVIAQQVIAAADDDAPDNGPVNNSPTANDGSLQIDENSLAGTFVGTVNASDPDAGQSLTYQIVSGNTNNAFSIDPVTGIITVSNSAALNFESTPVFNLTVEVTDNGSPQLSDTATIQIQLNDVWEHPPASVYVFGNDLVVQGGSGADEIYLWSGSTAQQTWVWMNGTTIGSWILPASGRVIVRAGDGNDRVFADALRISATLLGENGHDLIVGTHRSDILDGGSGVDRLVGNYGDDLIRGGDGDDYVYGGDGNDILIGGSGNDYLEGSNGRDLIIGGLGADYMKAGASDDLLVAGTTSYDLDDHALRSLALLWNSQESAVTRSNRIQSGVNGEPRLAAGVSVFDDASIDTICGGEGTDLVFAAMTDAVYSDLYDLFASA